jgi:hypothetical protein
LAQSRKDGNTFSKQMETESKQKYTY